MKYCFSTFVTSAYVVGYEVLVTSIKENCPWFDCDFLVFYKDLSERDMCRCMNAYAGTKLIPVDVSRYENLDVSKCTPGFVKCAYKLDMFGIEGYDKVIMIDCDMVVVRDIKNVLKFGPITAAWRKKGHFNLGLVVMSGGFLGKDVRDEMIQTCPTVRQPDQDMFNIYFKGKISRLPDQYNVKYYSEFVKAHGKKKVAIIHYQHNNPWNETRIPHRKKRPWKYWWRYYAKVEDNNGGEPELSALC